MLISYDKVNSVLPPSIEKFTCVLRYEFAEFVNKNEVFLAFAWFAGEGCRNQFVDQKRAEKALIVLGNHILSGQINQENLSAGKDTGKVQGVGILPQHWTDELVFHEGFNPIERRFNSFLAAVDLGSFQPLPFSANAWIADARGDRGSHGVRHGIDQMLRLD